MLMFNIDLQMLKLAQFKRRDHSSVNVPYGHELYGWQWLERMKTTLPNNLPTRRLLLQRMGVNFDVLDWNKGLG